MLLLLYPAGGTLRRRAKTVLFSTRFSLISVFSPLFLPLMTGSGMKVPLWDDLEVCELALSSLGAGQPQRSNCVTTKEINDLPRDGDLLSETRMNEYAFLSPSEQGLWDERGVWLAV